MMAVKGVDLSRKPLTTRERQWLRNERARLLAEAAYMKLREGQAEAVSGREADAFFRLDEYVTGTSRERKILTVGLSIASETTRISGTWSSKLQRSLEVRTMANNDELFVTSHVARDLLQNAALFKTDKLVVWEYVSNGLQYVDVGANPIVKATLDSKKKRIVIEDNGRGMDWPALQNFASSEKSVGSVGLR